jgi:FAD:protein FMN transferase
VQRVEVLNTWSERTFRAMGTNAHVLVHGGPPDTVARAERDIERLERLWSRFRADTDVTRLNHADGQPVHVAPETLDLVELACAMWRDTDGRFDPTVLHALEANGYDETFERVRDRPAGSNGPEASSAPSGLAPLSFSLARVGTHGPQPAPGCAGISLDRARSRITLPRGVGLDLGGIGKGYAADLVSRAALAWGADGVCVGLGGDIRCRGVGPVDGAWPIAVEDPFDEQRVMMTHVVRDGAIVTSTQRFRRWRHEGTWRHHIIDPANGMPARSGLTAVIVTDRTTWRAEGFAKAALVAGRGEGTALLRRARVTGWLVDDRGRASVVDAAADEHAA